MMKTVCGHFLPLPQYVYNGLACPADYFVFLHGNGLAALCESGCWPRNGLANTESVLIYSHTAIVACCRRSEVITGWIFVGQGRNSAPAAGYHIAGGGIITNYVPTRTDHLDVLVLALCR